MALTGALLFYGMPLLVWVIGFGYLIHKRDLSPDTAFQVALAGAIWVIAVPWWLFSYWRHRRARTNEGP